MTIKEILLDIVETIGEDETPFIPLTFFYGNKALQNLEADNGIFPAVFLDIPIRSEWTLRQSGSIDEAYNLSILFLDKAQLDSTSEEQEFIKMNMKEYAREFMLKFRAHSSVMEIDRVEGEDVEDLLDTNVSGYMLNFFVQLKYDKSNCF